MKKFPYISCLDKSGKNEYALLGHLRAILAGIKSMGEIGLDTKIYNRLEKIKEDIIDIAIELEENAKTHN